MRWQSLPPLFACFTAFLSFCLCIITLLFFKEKKTMRPRFILTKRDAFSYSFLLWEAVTPEFVLLLIVLGQLLGARAVSQRSSKWDQGNSANLHPQRICLMRFATRHVISLLESPLADTKFPLRSLPKLLKILQTTSKSPWNGLWAKREKLLCLSPVTYVPLRCPLPPSQPTPAIPRAPPGCQAQGWIQPPHPIPDRAHWPGTCAGVSPHSSPQKLLLCGGGPGTGWLLNLLRTLHMRLGKMVEPSSLSQLPISNADMVACPLIHPLSGA